MRSLIPGLIVSGFLLCCALSLLPYYDLSIRPMTASSRVIHVPKSTSAHAFVALIQQEILRCTQDDVNSIHHADEGASRHVERCETSPQQNTWRQRIDAFALLTFIKTKGLAHQLKAGIYGISPGESIVHVLNRVVQGDVLTLAFRIDEGHTVRQISQQLQDAPYLQYQAVDWQRALPQQNPEGLLLADTYRYIAGDNAVRLLSQAKNRLHEVLEQAWLQRDKTLPYQNAYELLIAASIIEKEAAFSDERRLIGGVVVNRLRAHMPLQMDPTVIYALGQAYQGHLSHADLSVDSPYNTYHHRGLPPTPIGMVSQDAIRAAAQPQVSRYLYFVARGDGRHTFSETYEQQRQAVARYRARNAS